MVSKEIIKNTVDKMILSASGWRGIFSEDADNEESKSEKITEAHRIISASAAYVFNEYLRSRRKNTVILLGADTRPTGSAIIKAMIPVLLASGCEVHYAGIAAAPEIMAWARSTEEKGSSVNNCAGFIYVSASHNPIGHNGIKFGLTDGGALAAEEAAKLIERFHSFIDNDDCVLQIDNLDSAADPGQILKVFNNIEFYKSEARKAYYDFCGDVVWGDASPDNSGACGFPAAASALKDGLAERPLGIVCDFNGSARTVSIDRDFFSSLGFGFECINGEPGQIAHRIVPEGESLLPCAALLEEAHSRDPSYVLGYVPDCDGDRGNLVIWWDDTGTARPLEAQEVFALACAAELSHLVWTKNNEQLTVNSKQFTVSYKKSAVVVNDPTSMRIDRIAEVFGVSVFRAEVGEANVVSLARKLREEGYLVRILGEGSAGGNITHPSAVRDPINTVLAIAKLLCIQSTKNKGLFEIWCDVSGQIEKYRDDFSLADIIATLPAFVTTSAYSKEAVLHINTEDHSLLKDRYQQIFLREWDKRKDELKTRYDFQSWEAVAYNGTSETRNLKRFGEAGRGGLKILFKNSEGKETAYIWMRGSATEPVFRVMADVKGSDILPERDLLDWQRKMIIEADNN